MRSKLIMICITVLALTAVTAWAVPPVKKLPLSFKTDLAYDGTYTFKLSLWDAKTGGAKVWVETQSKKIKKHVLDCYLGASSTLEIVNFSTQYWVQVAVQKADGTWRKMGGRVRLDMAPYSLWSEGVMDDSITSEDIIDGEVKVVDLEDGTALAEILDDDGAGSWLDADLLDGQHGAYYRNVSNVNDGTLGTSYYSAFSDLGFEGYLNDASGDLAQNNGTLQSNLNADMLDGQHAGNASGSVPLSNGTLNTNLDADMLDGQHGSFYQNADNINAGTLNNDRFSAQSDLSAEGYLNNDAGGDIPTRDQADGRYVNVSGDTMSGSLTVQGHTTLGNGSGDDVRFGTGDVQYSTAKTRYWSAMGSALMPAQNGSPYNGLNGTLKDTQGNSFTHAVHLPHGAVVTEVRLYAADNILGDDDGSCYEDFIIELIRKQHDSHSPNLMAQITTNGASASSRQFTDDDGVINYTTIDNQDYGYQLQVSCMGIDSWDHYVNGVRITYTVTEPLP